MTRAEAERELNSDKNPREIKASMLKELKKGNPEVFEMLYSTLAILRWMRFRWRWRREERQRGGLWHFE